MIFNAKVETMNSGSDFHNINVVLVNGEKKNLKLTPEQVRHIELGKTYHFEIESFIVNEREQFRVIGFPEGIFEHIKDPVLLKEELKSFYEYAPVEIKDLRTEVEVYLSAIDNPVIKAVTEHIYNSYRDSFYMYPAAVRFHHAYMVVLLITLKTMLDIAKSFTTIYPYLNKDLLFGGIILHDICKVDELSGFEGGEYTVEGQLLGHLVMGAMKIKESAKNPWFRKMQKKCFY